jgi:excisionase family DNA binding protein
MTTLSEPLADSIPGAAARLGVSRSLTYLLIKSNEIRALKVRGRTIITRAEQERYLASLAQSQAT